ncbi:diguanylate cyclase [Corallincola platygyrae]|uniref:diguanylate cyclase n=1 Tax=Corallincola platygyrae TaxID=1193278 RepID=A0ABW4XMS6_9GAMM
MKKHYKRLFIALFSVFSISSIIWAATPSELERQLIELERGKYLSHEEFNRKIDTLLKLIPDTEPQLLMRWKRLDCWRMEPVTDMEYAEAAAKATQYIMQAEMAGDLDAYTDFHICRGWYRQYGGDVDSGLEDYNKAIELIETSKNDQLIADAYSVRGELLTYQGDLALGLSDLLKAQHHYEAAGLSYWGNSNMASVANTYRRIGDFGKALEYYHQLEKIYLESANNEELIVIRDLIGLVLEDQGEYEKALALYSDTLDYYQTKQDEHGVANSRLNLAGAFVLLGKPDDALQQLNKARAFFEKVGDNSYWGLINLFEGRAQHQLKDYRKALSHFAAAEPEIKKEKNIRFLSWLQESRAKSYAASGLWKEAYQESLAYNETHKMLDKMLKNQQTIRMQVEFDVARKEAENIRLKADTLIKQKQVESLEERKRWQAVVMLLGGVLLFVLVVYSIRQIKSKQRLHQLACTDELTGLPNRRNIMDQGNAFLSQARDENSAFSILVFDVDYFKRINDTFGHIGGDEVLKRLAPAASSAVRIQDRVGRTGGEEFIALLPGAKLDAAEAIGERLRARIEKTDQSATADDLVVTVSIGVTELKPSDRELSALIQRADNALYKAKALGRNRVESEL